MSLFIIGNAVLFTDPITNALKSIQNFFTEDLNILHLPFVYRGAQKTKNGDNISSQLILPANPLTLNFVQDAVSYNWSAEVITFKLNDDYTSPASGAVLSRDFWIVTGFNYNTQAVELELSSALDAVGAQAPNARITYQMVGALPSTGAIRSG